jgi:hypothetical protein
LKSPSRRKPKWVKDAQPHDEAEIVEKRADRDKKLLKLKTIDITNQAQEFEDGWRQDAITKTYGNVSQSPLKPKNPKTRGELIDIYKNMIHEPESPTRNPSGGNEHQFGLNNSTDHLNSSKNNYQPPTAGKRGKKSGTVEEEQKQDKERLREIMMKLYEGHDNDEYTDEQRYLMMMAEGDNAPELNPMVETLKGFLRSRLAYHKVRNIEEAVLINDILDAWVKPNGENFGMSLKKIICATRCILQKKQILLMDDDALFVPESPNLMDDVFNEMPESTIISVVNDYENLLFFDEVIVFNEGFISERGDPRKLLMDKSSMLQMIIKRVDKHLSKLLIEMLDDGKDEKEMFEALFRIPSWMKKEGFVTTHTELR